MVLGPPLLIGIPYSFLKEIQPGTHPWPALDTQVWKFVKKSLKFLINWDKPGKNTKNCQNYTRLADLVQIGSKRAKIKIAVMGHKMLKKNVAIFEISFHIFFTPWIGLEHPKTAQLKYWVFIFFWYFWPEKSFCPALEPSFCPWLGIIGIFPVMSEIFSTTYWIWKKFRDPFLIFIHFNPI